MQIQKQGGETPVEGVPMKNNEFVASVLSFSLRQAARDERGSATILALVFISLTLLVGGIGVDLMRSEMDRTLLQNTQDRAVLAAADLDQQLDPEAVVHDYFAKAGMSQYLNSVTVDAGLNYRIVSANARTVTPTQFMRFLGVDEINAPALSAAEERVSKIEISMVLDISGSMRHNGKIANLRDAANTFNETLIRDETKNLISISIVPYSEHVNAGPAIFNALPNVNYRHNLSHCVEFPDSHFTSAGLDPNHRYDQMQHFQWYYGNLYDVSNTTCPKRSYEQIQPFSQNLTALQNQINQLQPRAQTSIFLGVKWAAALLDPSSRSVVTNLINSGNVDANFAGRPADYSDDETMKTIIVMTDGVNTDSYRINEARAYYSPSLYAHWARFNFRTYLDYYTGGDRSRFYYRKYSGSSGDALLNQVCTAAKDQGIVIWGVGFEVDNHGASVLENCASTPSHFFRVEGVEITEAFKSIATQLNQLRLTQ